MGELPRGTVTLLFTDVEGSTTLLQRLGRRRYVDVLETHRRLLREAFTEHGGVEVEMQGDSFFFAFPYARDAAAAAAAGQRALAEHTWPDDAPMRVRIGLHTGEPEQSDGLYAGIDVHRAARVMSAGHGGQVLLSDRTADLVDGELPEGIALRDLGSHRLKDLGAPIRLHDLVIDGLPGAFPPPKTLKAPPTLRRRSLLPLALLAVLAAAVAAFFLVRGGRGDEPAAVEPNAVVGVDLAEDAVAEAFPVGTTPTSLAATPDALWVLSADDRTVTRVDPASGDTRTISIGLAPTALAADGNGVWVSEGSTGKIARVDPSDGAVAAVIEQPDLGAENAIGAWGQLALDGPRLWVLNRDRTVSRVDTVENRVASRFGAGDVGKIAVGEDAVWVGGFTRIFRIDPDTESIVAQIDLTTGIDGITGLTVGEGSVWATVESSGTLWQIDPATNRVRRTIDLGRGAGQLAVAGGAVWVGSTVAGTLTALDPSTGRTLRTLELARPIRGIGATRDMLWISVG